MTFSLTEFNPLGLLMIALLNPVVIVISIWMGRKADQWQKIPVVGFAASLVGVVFVWLVTFVGLLPASGFGGTAGLLIAQMIFGMIWAGGAYYLFGERRNA